MTQPNLAQAGNTSSISEAQQATQDADSQSAQAANETAETTVNKDDAGSEKQPAATTGGDNDGETVDFQKKWEEAHKHIKTLNAENAKHRNAAKVAKEAEDAFKKQGNTSACAEKSPPRPQTTSRTRKYLRVCGEERERT